MFLWHARIELYPLSRKAQSSEIERTENHESENRSKSKAYKVSIGQAASWAKSIHHVSAKWTIMKGFTPPNSEVVNL